MAKDEAESSHPSNIPGLEDYLRRALENGEQLLIWKAEKDAWLDRGARLKDRQAALASEIAIWLDEGTALERRCIEVQQPVEKSSTELRLLAEFISAREASCRKQ